jgi:hypothetical protein
VTLQAIDDNWKLWNLPVAFKLIEGPHTAEAIGALVGELIQPYLGNLTTFTFFFFFFILFIVRQVSFGV